MPKVVKDEDIYHAVIQVITERGYAGATTKQMAEAAQVSEVTLFRKYGTKLQLVREAIASIIDQTDFESAAQHTGDVETDLLRVVQMYQDSAVKHGQFFSVMLSEMPRYPELVELADAPFDIFKDIGNLLARYQAEGILRREHPLHATAALLGPLIYTAMMRSELSDRDMPALDLPTHVACFLEGRFTLA
jgi:AcrR family transcriptional regulator